MEIHSGSVETGSRGLICVCAISDQIIEDALLLQCRACALGYVECR